MAQILVSAVQDERALTTAAEVTEHLGKSDRVDATLAGARPLPPGLTGNSPGHRASVWLLCGADMQHPSKGQEICTSNGPPWIHLHYKVFLL